MHAYQLSLTWLAPNYSYPKDATRAHLCATLSLLVSPVQNLDSSWLSELPASETSTMHDCSFVTVHKVNTRALVAAVFERIGNHESSIEWAQAEVRERVVTQTCLK